MSLRKNFGTEFDIESTDIDSDDEKPMLLSHETPPIENKNDDMMPSLLEKIADALGYTTNQIWNSKRFEEAVYDIASSVGLLPKMNSSTNAWFTLDPNSDDPNSDRIRITHKIKYKSISADIEKLAEFYKKHFPETDPQYIHGLEPGISFLREPFIQQVLPAMKTLRTRPSCIASNSICHVDSNTMLLESQLTPESGNALFITGADEKLGNWKTAFRMIFNESSQNWEYKLPVGLKNNEFRFLMGIFDLGEEISNVKEKVKKAELIYESNHPKILNIHAPLDKNIELQKKPEGTGLRC